MKLPIVKWGNTQAIRLPVAILELLGVRAGDSLEGKVEAGTLVLKPASKYQYDLSLLVEGITPANTPRLLIALEGSQT